MTSTSSVSSTTPNKGAASCSTLVLDAVNTELVVRILNPARERFHGSLLHGFIYRGDAEQTIIEEIIRDGQIEEMRICLLSNTNDILPPADIRRYALVNRLEVSVPAPCICIFDWTSCLPVLKLVRLGSGFFGECKELPMKKIERSPTVTDLIINFDKQKYDALQKTEQSRLQNKLDNLLDLASKHLPNLSYVDLVLPSGEALNTFLNKCQHLKFNGEKTENYALGMVTFRTIRSQVSQPKAGPSQRRPSAHAPPKMKRARTECGVGRRSPEEHHLESDPGTPPIQVVDLAESDSDDNKTPPRVVPEPEPQLPEPPRDPRLGGAFYNRRGRGGHGRGSPSLLE